MGSKLVLQNVGSDLVASVIVDRVVALPLEEQHCSVMVNIGIHLGGARFIFFVSASQLAPRLVSLTFL